jgi:hypothetical protein
MFDHPEAATQVRDQVGAGGFTGNTGAYRLPTFKDYVFGSELDVTGILVNGRRVDFRPADANFIDLTVSALIGSCPYLLAWDSRDHEWVDTGKMLHEATSKEREYSETRRFRGLSSRFRLEEREPEIAFIDHAGLTLELKNGETLTLETAHPQLAARDGRYLQLYWVTQLISSSCFPQPSCRMMCSHRASCSPAITGDIPTLWLSKGPARKRL